MTCVNNVAWAVFFVWSGVPTGVLAVAACVLFAGLLTRDLTRLAGGVDPRQVAALAAWLTVMVCAGLLWGRVGLGAALNVALLIQVVPSVVTAWRSMDVSGICVVTWLLVMAELTSFGLLGPATQDRTLVILGLTGDVAGVLLGARVAVASRASWLGLSWRRIRAAHR